jgi:hypothetical protein
MDGSFAVGCSLHEPYLFDTRDGRVLRCACCGRIQIEFRGLSLLIDTDKFETLLRTLDRILEKVEGDESGSWRLSAPTDAGEVSVRLTLDQLRALYKLLDGAQAMRKLEADLGAVAVGEHCERPPASWGR